MRRDAMCRRTPHQYSEERLRGALLRIGRRLDDGRDEAPQEARDLEERGPEVVEAVDEQALDVGPALVRGASTARGERS